MNEKPKFGDKSIGRSPIERLIVWLEAYNFLHPILNLLVLIILVGTNSIIREEPTKGVMFLILVFLILLSGNEPTENFFGASALAVFIILHISLFGFNSIPLMISFVIYLFFRKKLERNLLGPISIYLLLDTLSYHFNLSKNVTVLFDFLGEKLFSYNVFVLLSIIPITYLYLKFERIFKRYASNEVIRSYGFFIFLSLLISIFLIMGNIFAYQMYYVSGLFILFYVIGLQQYKNELKKLLLITIPIILILFLFSYFFNK